MVPWGFYISSGQEELTVVSAVLDPLAAEEELTVVSAVSVVEEGLAVVSGVLNPLAVDV